MLVLLEPQAIQDTLNDIWGSIKRHLGKQRTTDGELLNDIWGSH